jgi:hypothetical protein
MGLAKTPVALPTILSPLGKACARMDLTAVHDILLKTGYRDEEGAENEVSFFHFLTASHFLTVTPKSVHRADRIELDIMENN